MVQGTGNLPDSAVRHLESIAGINHLISTLRRKHQRPFRKDTTRRNSGRYFVEIVDGKNPLQMKTRAPRKAITHNLYVYISAIYHDCLQYRCHPIQKLTRRISPFNSRGESVLAFARIIQLHIAVFDRKKVFLQRV